MSSLETDVPMAGVGEPSSSARPSSSTSKKPKRFEIKKWNAVSLWAWDIVVDTCAICRNHIMDLWLGQLNWGLGICNQWIEAYEEQRRSMFEIEAIDLD